MSGYYYYYYSVCACDVCVKDLSMNQLSSLPTCIDGLRRLMKLNVANNLLKTLPHQLGLISSLYQFFTFF